MARKRYSNIDATGRSKRVPRHVRFYEWELASPAFRSLSCYDRALLIELKRLYNGQNNGEIYLSVRDAASLLNIHKDTAAKSFRNLEDRGFIRPKAKGSFNLKVRHATVWILTEFNLDNELATKDFMHWRPSGKQKSVLSGRTNRPEKSDRVPRKRTVKNIHSPNEPDCDREITPDSGPKESDTVNLPSNGEGSRKNLNEAGIVERHCDPDLTLPPFLDRRSHEPAEIEMRCSHAKPYQRDVAV